MSLPIREQIINKLQARTGAHRVLPSYDERDLPITAVEEGAEIARNDSYGMTHAILPLRFLRSIAMSGVKDDLWHRTQNIAQADLHVDIFSGGDDIDGLAEGMEYTGGDINLLIDGAKGIAVEVNVSVRYSFVHGNPFSQDADAEFDDITEEET